MRRVLLVIFVLIAVGLASWLYLGDYFRPHTTQPPSSPSKPTQDELACVNALPTDVKIGQKLMAAGYSAQFATETPVFEASDIGGVIIMDQIPASQLGVFRSAQSIMPFIATDQEGGSVQRYTEEGVVPGATDMANDFSPTQAYDQYFKDDQYLKSIGITTNFAPIVDILSTSPSPLPGRIYSTNTTDVINYASAAIKASTAVGITPVIKHFPGLGSASGNTDFGSATTDSLATLQTRDLIPYTKLAGLHPDVMVSNAIVPGLTDDQPASLSAAAVALLRSKGYQQAVIYSDSLTAKGVPGLLQDAVVQAWQAGIDVALIVQTDIQTPSLDSYIQSIITRATAALQSGELNNADFSASVARIFARKGIDACQLKIGLIQK